MTVRPVRKLHSPTAAHGIGLASLALSLAGAASACGVTDIDALLVPSGPSGPTSGSTSGSSGTVATPPTDGGATPPEASTIVAATGKRGLAYGYDSVADLQTLANRGPNGTDGTWWWLNWTAHPDNSLGANAASTAAKLGIEYVPMIFNLPSIMGTTPAATAAAAAALGKQIPPGTKYLLTFNGANFADTTKFANLTPQMAAAAWASIEVFANSYPGLKIVSPTVDYCTSNCVSGYDNPFTWLSVFLSTCVGCQIDYIGVRSHKCDYAGFVSDLAQYKQLAQGTKLWITELWCDPTTDPDAGVTADQFMQQATQELETDQQVFRYGWFTGRPVGAPPDDYDILAPEAGVLTPLGLCYTQPDLPACTMMTVGSE
jgi:hypothetical protein